VIYLSWRTTALHPGLRRLAYTAGIFLLMQVAIGIGTYMLHLQIEPLTVLHQAVGAALLGTLVAFTGLAWRDRTEAV
jgi:cytochrome c oxidase assembly protein subunit 15